MAAKTSRADFEAVFPQLVEDVSQAALKYNIPSDALKWFQKVSSTSTTV
jgi:farnesyl diphosphate synthase